MLKWLIENGADVHGIYEKPTSSAGTGLFASSEFKLSIPVNLLLSVSRVVSLLPARFSELLSTFTRDERFILNLFLIYARYYNSDTFFSAYVRSLPSCISTPLALPSHLVSAYYGGTFFERLILGKQKKLATYFEAMKPFFDASGRPLQLDDVVWAETILSSRTLSFKSTSEDIPDDLHLVPFLDFANHSAQPNSFWMIEDGKIELLPSQEFTKETEVCIKYGDVPNTEFLFNYGFMESRKESDTIYSPLTFSEEEYLKRGTMMLLSLKPMIEYRPCSGDLSGILSTEGWCVVYIKCLSEQEFELFDQDEEGSLFIGGKAISSPQDFIDAMKACKTYQDINNRTLEYIRDDISHISTSIEERLELVSTSPEEATIDVKLALAWLNGQIETAKSIISVLNK